MFNQNFGMPPMTTFEIPADDDLELGDAWADHENKIAPEITYHTGREFADPT